MNRMKKNLAMACALCAVSTWAAWNPGEPVTTYWFGPGCPGKYGMPMTDFWAKQLKEGGFNTVWANTPEELDIAAKYGLRTIPTGDAVQLFRDRLPVDYGKPLTRAEIAALEEPATIDFHGDVAGASVWARGREGRHKDWNEVKLRPDFSHLNARGHYLQACIWVGFLFGVDPTTFSYRPKSLPEADAKLMRECARDALKSSSAGPGSIDVRTAMSAS